MAKGEESGWLDPETGDGTLHLWIVGLYPPDYDRRTRERPWRLLAGSLWRRLDRGDSLSPDESDALILDVAFAVELNARRFFVRHHEAGELPRRRVLVFDRTSAERIHRALRRRQPSAAIRIHLDRALAWSRAALEAGMRIRDPSPPEHEDITDIFAGLMTFARSRPPINTADHGIELVRPPKPATEPKRRSRTPMRLRWRTIPWPTTATTLRLTVLVGLVACLVAGLGAHRQRSERRPALSCAARLAETLERAERVEAESPEKAALIAEIRDLIAAGQTMAAFRRWDEADKADNADNADKADKADNADNADNADSADKADSAATVELDTIHEVLFGADLLLLSQCRPQTRRPR